MSDNERDGGRPGVDPTPEVRSTGAPSGAPDGNGSWSSLLAWVDVRTGLGTPSAAVFDAPVPSVARWRYALGASMVSSLVVQAVTGFLMMTAYSPSAATAWGSTFYIDRVLTAGWFLRGLHSFAAHAMIVTVALHLASVVVAGVYRAPRELNWWLGLAMLGLVIGFILTGNALVWDQDGYWAWNVETSIAGVTPVVGPLISGGWSSAGPRWATRRSGGSTRCTSGLLPVLVIVLLGAPHARDARPPRMPDAPGRLGSGRSSKDLADSAQVFANLLASAVLLGIVSTLVVCSTRGVATARLARPDPASEYPARPAWFFFWLFELPRSSPARARSSRTMVIPGGSRGGDVAAPVLLDKVFPPEVRTSSRLSRSPSPYSVGRRS